QELPVKAKKQPRRQETKTVLLLRYGEQVAIRRREDGGLLGGLWEFPNVPGCLSPAEVSSLLEEWTLSPKDVQKAGTKRHIFTHVEWELLCYTAQCGDCGEELVWVTQEDLDKDFTLPTAFKKLSVFL
ncbi:MAG: NUDIX domain-containing protein, partial [Angelakisella sp.]